MGNCPTADLLPSPVCEAAIVDHQAGYGLATGKMQGEGA
jgi:hypothetical protein